MKSAAKWTGLTVMAAFAFAGRGQEAVTWSGAKGTFVAPNHMGR